MRTLDYAATTAFLKHTPVQYLSFIKADTVVFHNKVEGNLPQAGVTFRGPCSHWRLGSGRQQRRSSA